MEKNDEGKDKIIIRRVIRSYGSQTPVKSFASAVSNMDNNLSSAKSFNETELKEYSKVDSLNKTMDSPIFRIKEAEKNLLQKSKKRAVPKSTSSLQSSKRSKKQSVSTIKKTSLKNSVSKILNNQELKGVDEPLPNIEEAQLVDDEHNKSKNYPQDPSNTQNKSFLDNKICCNKSDVQYEIIDIKVDGKSCEQLKLKMNKMLAEKKKLSENWKSGKKDSDKNCSENNGNGNQTIFQTMVENFLRNPQIEKLNNSDFLKKGLCYVWLANNFNCSNQHCIYNHNASRLFLEKLKCLSSRHILLSVASMRNDELFVDITLSALKILCRRKEAILWITFLVYFVFYVIEPTDRKFIKFWVNAARFFYINQDYGGANGFASLLCIFSQGKKSDEKKIIEFIKIIQKPPIELLVTYALLSPILNLNLSTELLTAAVESANDTQVDAVKVYLTIVPKLLLKNFPIDTLEILLKFCQTLDELNEYEFSQTLRRRLKPKIQQYKIKIVKEDFPNAAKFQEELVKSSTITYQSPLENLDDDLDKKSRVFVDNDYFEPKKQFVDEMIRAVNFKPRESQPAFHTLPKDNAISVVPDKVFREENITREQVQKAVTLFNDQQFELFGKYLNELKNDAQQLTAEHILSFLFKMKVSLQQVVDLIKLLIYFCNSKNSAKVLASISLTVVLNLVKIGEWDKAYILVLACINKEIEIIDGTVFMSEEFISFSKLKIAIIILELYIFKKNFESALELVKNYWLYSPNRYRWILNWKDCDEIIRIKIVEKFLWVLILEHSTEMAHELFMLILKEQKETNRPIDLNKFVNDVFGLLLNQNNEEAVFLYEKLRLKFKLDDNVIRAILVALVRQERFVEAKRLLFSYNQSIYIMPKVTFGVLTVKLCSCWLEEEIYVFFDCLFDLLIKKKKNKGCVGFLNYGSFQIIINMSKEETIVRSKITPLCLSLLDSSEESAFIRIQKVLQNQFVPPISLIYNSDSLKLDSESLQLYIGSRILQAF